MRFWVGVTDGDWYRALSAQPGIDDVNFWQPSGGPEFKTLPVGGMFLFKLHSPDNFVVGGGVFAGWVRFPVSMAWAAFGVGNGVASLAEMRRRVEKYRKGAKAAPNPTEDYQVGCVLLTQPFFCPRPDWIPVPEDWHRNIQVGKGYDLTSVTGRRLRVEVQERLARQAAASPVAAAALPLATSEPANRFGEPVLIRPRLGQGSFRVLVTDTYERRCAITRERTLPALEAAHIRPYSDDGEHRVDNGLLLRRDLHALFDAGYLTVTPALQVEVSKRIREEFDNGKDYYAMAGTKLWVPDDAARKPNSEFLRWHNEGRYLG